MSLIRTYEDGESMADVWFSLHKRKGRYWPHRWVLTVKMPWKARIYTINNDSWQLRHPRISLSWHVYKDSLWHQCTKEELERQNKAMGI